MALVHMEKEYPFHRGNNSQVTFRTSNLFCLNCSDQDVDRRIETIVYLLSLSLSGQVSGAGLRQMLKQTCLLLKKEDCHLQLKKEEFMGLNK